MFGALYIGLSGLSAYQRGLTAVSNNVTNLNSAGYKASDVTFSDVYNAGGQSLGGSGASGQGAGVRFGATSIDFNPGDLRQTERDLDLAVEGNGFLVLIDGERLSYATTGSFTIDDDGFILLQGTKQRLAALDGVGRPVALNIDNKRTDAPEPTTAIRFSDNLSSSAASHAVNDITVFDASGKSQIWRFTFTRLTDKPGAWSVAATDATGKAIGSHEIRFINGAIDAATAKATFEDSGAGLKVDLDLSSGVTSFSSGEISTLRAASVNGHGAGAIASIRVNAEGIAEIGYTNEQKAVLGAIAIADFRDPQQLVQGGGGVFTHEGGLPPDYLSSDDSRVGRVLSRRLQGSNVDLGQQFGELILIQRGFQASSQIVSVANDMIQQLFGIRGQG